MTGVGAVGTIGLLERFLVESVPSHRGIDFLLGLAVTDVQHKKVIKVVIAEVRIQNEEERHVVGALASVPRRHYMRGVVSRGGVIQMLLHELLVDRVMPGFATLASANRISATCL